jgi:hypothetical protein
MNGSATRYPGAQPFSDDALSRKIFFGREREVIALSDQILANRMVVVYARSGLAVHAAKSRGKNVTLRVTKQPEHGTGETIATTNYPNYPKENIRFKCNEHKVRGMQISYKSAEKYVGDDTLDLLVLFPAGTAWEVHYDISVR